jgi:hypothetical protein
VRHEITKCRLALKAKKVYSWANVV